MVSIEILSNFIEQQNTLAPAKKRSLEDTKGPIELAELWERVPEFRDQLSRAYVHLRNMSSVPLTEFLFALHLCRQQSTLVDILKQVINTRLHTETNIDTLRMHYAAAVGVRAKEIVLCYIDEVLSARDDFLVLYLDMVNTHPDAELESVYTKHLQRMLDAVVALDWHTGLPELVESVMSLPIQGRYGTATVLTVEPLLAKLSVYLTDKEGV